MIPLQTPHLGHNSYRKELAEHCGFHPRLGLQERRNLERVTVVPVHSMPIYRLLLVPKSFKRNEVFQVHLSQIQLG